MDELPAQVLSWARTSAALALCSFGVYTAYFGVWPDILQQGVHLSLILFLAFTAQPAASAIRRGLDIGLGLLGFALIFYHVAFYETITARYGAMTDAEFWLGIGAILLLLEATRRVVGSPMAILVLVFLIFPFVGSWMPDLLSHRGYSAERVVSQMYIGGGGIFGTPLMVSSTYVITIVIFGAVLERTGGANALMDIATGATGRMRGGPAKASVVGSTLMGMVSGTAVANVLTTGTISIPLMIRSGYRRHVAGAVEAVASTGGQLMPPVMGAAAFIMAETTGIPYLEIALAALIPALVYYVVLLSVVHFEALKHDIKALSADETPSVLKTFNESSHLLLGIPTLIYALSQGYSVMYASFWAILVATLAAFVRRSTWITPRKVVQICQSAGESILPVAVACASAGMVIGIITLTGVGLKISSLIITLSGGSLFLALVLTMFASLVLGMGLPTAAAYILVATLVAPALVELGVPLLAAHFFVFYSAMLSSITPPVAMAAYAAAGIAKASPLKIAVTASVFGISAFIIPYAIVLRPSLLGIGSWVEVSWAVLNAVIVGIGLASMVSGYWLRPLNILERAAMGAASFAILLLGWKGVLLGAAIIIGISILQWRHLSRRVSEQRIT
ncbi:TRAP transporter fused permease subunit [Rhodobacteraceae bacterium]|nr:TRAP transporter fused permease subunit [Paracoccaceae bacterium]